MLERKALADLSLGSNIGPRKKHLVSAIKQLNTYPALKVSRCSAVYETIPIGMGAAEPFWNLCLQVEVNELGLDRQKMAHVLLQNCLDCEQKLGRLRPTTQVKYSPRTIDIDLIDYEQTNCHTDFLHLPHPRFLERLFVLVPLLEVADAKLIEQYSLVERIQNLKGDWGHKILGSLV